MDAIQALEEIRQIAQDTHAISGTEADRGLASILNVCDAILITPRTQKDSNGSSSK